MHDLRPGRSPRLTGVLLVLDLGGLIALLSVLPPLGWPAGFGLCAILLWQFTRRKASDVLRAQGQIDGEWILTRRDGQRETGWQVDPERSFCHPWLVIVALHQDRKRRYLSLPADAVAAEALRRLRVSLRAAG